MGPVKVVVVCVTLAEEEDLEHFAQVGIVGLVSEFERAAVLEVGTKLGGISTSQHFNRRGHLLLRNHVVFLLLGRCLEPLPR